MKTFFKQYDNGVRFVFKKVEDNRPATLYIGVDTGSVKETKENHGISHFIEHLNFKGTKKRTAKQISTELEQIGANANAFTSKFNTCFYATCLNEKIENCFEILTDMVFDSTYKNEDIQKERKVVFEEIDMYQDDPESVCYEKFCDDFYAGTPLQKTILGTKESLEKISRKDILDYVKQNYVAKNIVVSVVGAFDKKYVESLVEKYVLSRFKEEDEIDEKNKSIVTVPNRKFSFLKKDVAQTQIVLGFPCDNIYCDKKMDYNLLCFVFGGGMGSRLFQTVREENGLCYSISSMPELYECGGDIVIGLGTNKQNQKKAVELVKSEIDKLVKDGISEEELNRAKNFCKSLVVSSSETGANMAKSNALNILTFNKVISVEERLEKIENVTLESIKAIVKKVFDYSNMCGCVISNEPDKSLFDIFC